MGMHHGIRLVLGASALTLLVGDAGAASLRGPVSIDLTDDGSRAVVALHKDNSIAIIDVSTSPPYAVQNLGVAHGIGRAPVKVRCFGSTAVVLHEHDTRLALVDVAAATVTGHVEVPMYSRDVVWDAGRSRYYVSNAAFDAVYVFDAGWAPMGTGIAVGRQPGPMALGPDDRLYVGNRASWDVSVVDLSGTSPASWTEVARVFLGSRPEDLAASAASVFVTNHGGDALTPSNGVPLILDDQVDIENVVTAIDPLTLGKTRLFVDQGGDYAGLDIGAGLLAFSGSGSGTVHVADMAVPGSLETVDLLEDGTLMGGTVPSGLRVFANTRDLAIRLTDQIFAVNTMRDTMAELRFSSGRWEPFGETALNGSGEPVTAFQPPPAVNLNGVQNGERYLNTIAAWKRGQRDFTCSTCHPGGHTDGRMIEDPREDPFDPPLVQGPETQPSLRLARSTPPYGWEGSRPELLSFNIAALDRHDRPATPQLRGVFEDVAEFMALFQTNLRPGPSPFPPNETGRDLFFNKAGCALCHTPPAFTDNNFYDIGTGRTLNIPSLVGVWERGPLLHDGRAATLEDVLDESIYDHPGRHGHLSLLTPQEKSDLVAFMRSLGPDTCLELAPSGLLHVGPAPCPPHVLVDPQHDFVRTTLAQIADTGVEVDLGAGLCLADQHEWTHLEDAADAGGGVGTVWVFLARPAGALDYGVSSAGHPRVLTGGDCPD